MAISETAARMSFGSPNLGVVPDTELITNGDFATGSLRGWTTFTTSGGTLGYPNDPKVRMFDVSGAGPENAAQFQVGQLGDLGTEEGGGLEQTITTVSGELDFSADIAAFSSKHVNLEGGVFSVLLDGATEDTVSFGVTPKGVTDRGTLSFDIPVTAGSHVIEILMTRDFQIGPKKGYTPYQYITDISASQPGGAVASSVIKITPAPAHQFIAAMAGLAGSAGGVIQTGHPMQIHGPMLARPRAMIA
jgi:hypothetical protein